MEELNKLSNAGMSYFDANMEFLQKTPWEKTPLGHRDKWCQPLISFINLVATLPHPGAVFWGKELTLAGNLAWGHASETDTKQGGLAKELYKGEGYDCLQKCKGGRTVTVAASIFLSKTPGYGSDAPILLSPVLDEHGERAGIFAQLIQAAIDKTESQDDQNLSALGINEGNEDEEKDLAEEGKEGSDEEDHASNATEEDDKEFEEDQKRKGQDPDSADSETDGSNGQSTHGNDKPTKQPILETDSGKLNLKSNRLFRRFAQMLPTGLAILDKEAEALFVNDNFFKLTSNKTHKTFRAWPESIHPDDYDRVMTDYRKAFSSREGLRTEFRCVVGEQPDPWRLFLMKPLNDAPEQGGFIVACVDISEMKAAELSQRLAAQEARDRKEQQERFVDMISHEIRNPLSAILHSSEEIREAVKQLDEKSEIALELMDATDTILLCVAHQSSLVDEILQFSKLDAAMLTLTPRIAQPKWDFSETLKLFQPELRAKQIKFSYAMDVSFDELKVQYVLADLKRIKQVLVNLMTNAIKFTAKKKGERHISVAMGATLERPDSYPPSVCFFSDDKAAAPVDVTLSSDWGDGEAMYLMVAVKDTGIGIDADGQAKLFERFRQATPKTQEKYGGSGLGLFISRKLCQLHGGDIGVSAKEGVGSTFGFYFRVRRSGVPDGVNQEEEEPDVESLSEVASKDVAAARSRAASLAKENNMEEFNQPQIDESERPDLKPGADEDQDDKIPDSLKNPPTKLVEEAHPGISTDERHDVTSQIAKEIQPVEHGVHSRSQKHRDSESNAKPPSIKDLQSQITPESDTGSQNTQKRNSILLAEDNIINQKVLKRQLQSKGYVVTPASNGKEAVAAVESAIRSQSSSPQPQPNDSRNLNSTLQNDQTASPATSSSSGRGRAPFDAVLMDQEMPYLSGNGATRAIRKLEKEENLEHMPILGVSANVRDEQKKEMIEAGMDDVITKPFKVDELVNKIKGLISDWDERG